MVNLQPRPSTGSGLRGSWPSQRYPIQPIFQAMDFLENGRCACDLYQRWSLVFIQGHLVGAILNSESGEQLNVLHRHLALRFHTMGVKRGGTELISERT